jgi:hypothetical protein
MTKASELLNRINESNTNDYHSSGHYYISKDVNNFTHKQNKSIDRELNGN